jgi:hypothetical protein
VSGTELELELAYCKSKAPLKNERVKNKYNANTADGVAARARKKHHKGLSKQRKYIKEIASAPDIGIKIDAVSKEDALKRLKKMETCVWTLQPTLFGPIKQKLICKPREIHDIAAYVDGVHKALAADKLWAVDTEYKTPKGVKQADQPASSMGMSNGIGQWRGLRGVQRQLHG